MTLAPATAAALDAGRALWNRGAWFEAHEVWEEAWRAELGEAKRLLQGLIQAAAAVVKARRDKNAEGTIRLLETALAKLDGFPDGSAGLALGDFRSGLRRLLDEARRWAEGGAAQATIPPLRITSSKA